MINRLSQNTRLIIASGFAALIIFIWQMLYVDPIMQAAKDEQKFIEDNTTITQPQNVIVPNFVDRIELVNQSMSNRVKFSNGSLNGSINLVGARIDDVILTKYHKTLDSGSDNVILMSPAKTKDSYFVEFGWLAQENSHLDLPNPNTIWTADKTELVAGQVLNLRHVSPQNIEFNIQISLDENYMFRFKQSVINNSSKEIKLSHYALINRTNIPTSEDNMIIHEGAIGVLNDKFSEVKYEDIATNGKIEYQKFEWLGFSDKYWLSSLIPTNSIGLTSKLSYSQKNNQQRYQASFNSTSSTEIEPHSKAEWPDILLFAGAKELDLLDSYEAKYNIKLFDRAVDFGILYFITKPIFELLHYFYGLVGNFGIAILLLTVFIKALLFPLAHKGFKGMNRLKELQPKMAELKEKYGDNATAFQRALLEMYKKEKVNPMGGCLPILLQIPIFFALYKVLYVTIEMRHAPFFGWIKDLSVPDPLTITNLFGLIPFTPPQYLMIGIFPILMALTMFFQQRLNPEPSDPIQAKVMKFLPLIFLFMFASFPSGLVIYWTWSNILSILQQLLIKRMEDPKRRVQVEAKKKSNMKVVSKK